MDPTLLALLGGGGGGGGGGQGGGGGGGGALSAVGGVIDTGFDMYTGLQQLDIARRNSRNQERMNKFSRLMQLLNSGQGMQDRLSGQNRLFSLRNPGV